MAIAILLLWRWEEKSMILFTNWFQSFCVILLQFCTFEAFDQAPFQGWALPCSRTYNDALCENGFECFRLKQSHTPEEYFLRSEGREYLQWAISERFNWAQTRSIGLSSGWILGRTQGMCAPSTSMHSTMLFSSLKSECLAKVSRIQSAPFPTVETPRSSNAIFKPFRQLWFHHELWCTCAISCHSRQYQYHDFTASYKWVILPCFYHSSK